MSLVVGSFNYIKRERKVCVCVCGGGGGRFSEFVFLKVSGLSLRWSLLSVLYHEVGPSGWSLMRVSLLRMVSPTRSLTKMVFLQWGLSSGVLLSGWPLFWMVFLQVDLSSGWSLTRVVSHQGGLSLGWSLIRVVS